MDLAAVATELYALPPSEFTSARNEKAKAARSAGESLVAKQIGRLPKPSAAAWAANLLARHRPEDLARVLDLGAELRIAQELLDSEAIRRLGPERQRLVTAVVREGRALARDFGGSVSEAAATDLEQTLRAGMADPEAAAAVRSGQLVRALASNGIDPVDLTDAVAVPGSLPESAPRQVPGVRGERVSQRDDDDERRRVEAERAQEREQARAEWDEAERSLRLAEAELADAESSAADVAARREGLAGRLAELKERLVGLEGEVAAVEREAGYAERTRKLAARVAEQERRAARLARERLDRLS
ncbi:hypothetical protein [Sinomonas sp. G460-2]|uniref:hypothetical protein n=1 Tax=Sinomonas sp. G460-2 TaxID=3393464 RepID=UPI0039EF2E9C